MKTWIKILWILISLGLIGAGVICILNPDITLTSIALFLGMALLLAGINQIVLYWSVRLEMTGSSWMLMEGLLTIFLAFFCFFHQYMTAITIPLIFSVWILFAGVSRVVSALDLKHWNIKEWWILLLLGGLLIGLGIASMLDPILAAFTLSILVGMIFIMEGIDSLVKGYYLNRAVATIKLVIKG